MTSHATAIATELASRAAECTAANGYGYDVAQVIRRELGALESYPHGTVEVRLGGWQRDESWSGSVGVTRWRQAFEVLLVVRTAAEDETPIDDLVGEAVRDLVHALNLPDLLGGLVDLIDVVSAEPLSPSPALGGALLTLAAVYRTDERDLAAQVAG